MLHFDKFSRRLFLKTASGYVLALPLIPSLISKAASAAVADQMSLDDTPNTILIRTMYGCYEELKFINDVPGENASDKWMSEIINFGPASNPRAGTLRTKNLSDYVSGSTNHPITSLFGTKFQEADLLDYVTIPLGNSGFHSCNHVNTAVYCGAGTVSKDEKVPKISQSSIDVLIEARMKQLIPSHKAIRVMPAGRLTTSSGSCSYAYNNQTQDFTRLPYLDSVQALFDLFFKAAPTDINGLKRAAMDNVSAEYRKLANLVSPEEKILLEQYANNIQEVSSLIGSGSVCTSPTFGPIDNNMKSTIYKASNTLITQALKCGLSKVVCLELCHYGENNLNASSFAASHHPQNGSELNENGNRFNLDIIIDLASKLKAVPNSNNGNLLDDSILFQTSEDNWNHVGDGGQAILMLGKAKGKVNSGKIYDFRLRYYDNFQNDGEHLVYRIDGNARQFGAMGWSPYYLLLEGIMQSAGLKREDYLLPGQFCYGHSPDNWSATYSGLRKKMDKFTDIGFKNEKKNGRWNYRDPEDQKYFDQPENFTGPTPRIFNLT